MNGLICTMNDGYDVYVGDHYVGRADTLSGARDVLATATGWNGIVERAHSAFLYF